MPEDCHMLDIIEAIVDLKVCAYHAKMQAVLDFETIETLQRTNKQVTTRLNDITFDWVKDEVIFYH